MPTFEVTSPDGRTFEVNAPEGATQQDAIEYVKSQGEGALEPQVSNSPDAPEEGGFFEDLRRAYLGQENPETTRVGLLPIARDAPGMSPRFGAPGALTSMVRAYSAPGRGLAEGLGIKQQTGYGETPSFDPLDEGANAASAIALGGRGLSYVAPKIGPPAGALAMNALTSKPVVAAAKGVSRAATSIAQPVIDRFDTQGAMGRALLKRVIQQNPGMSLEEAINATEKQMADLGPQSVLADTGTSTQRLARTMIQNPGETAPLAEDVLGKRQAGEGTRTVENTRQNVSPKFFYDAEAAANQSKKKAGPYYESAYNKNPNVSSLGLQLLLEQEPLVKQGINKGVELQRIEASTARQKFDPSRYGVVDFNDAGEPILGQVTPLRLWHAAREGLDALYEAEVNPLTKEVSKRGAKIAGLRKSLDVEIKSLTGGEKGDFAKADSIYADASKIKRALKDGRDFVSGDQEMTEKYFNSLSAKEKDAYRSGVAQEIIAMTRKKGVTPQSLIDALKDESGVRAKLKVILPTTTQFDAFVKNIEREVKFRETNKLRFGSPTFSLGQEEASANADVLGAMAHAGAQVAQGNHIGAVTSILSRASNAMKRTQMPQATRDKLGKLLLSQDPADKAEALRLMREAQGSGWLYAP